ncbi:secretion protein HlyD family protein [Arcobacter nitrofigilis DSM 7299]|uniref:Secretion protein HlyD family protein n=1 Tax=Arcobacter nitrofigilis (strain ATCC 33309 / DSM 7299 / CCUG 15893 / LMG 7604 / NCTC 12251 / CI) TaxID=572480 RepID=D5V0X1_ARCNC|nr:HlyD family secretion protein [Arcobacter nitrofigilis]ADG93933.1 secretion protein HlyD family protein [Arcobacter nitrofigilis DSM 7299]
MENNKKSTEKVKKNQSKRKKVLLIFLVLIILVGASFGLYWYFYASHYVSTDNAYTDVEIAQVTPSVGGTISDVLVSNTQVVKKGDILVKIDQTDTSLAVEEAKANLSLAIRRVKGYMANNNGLNALIEARKADEMRMNAKLSSAKADFQKAQIDLKRREKLILSGAISADELTKAKNAYENAKSNLDETIAEVKQSKSNIVSAIGSRNQNATRIDNVSVENNPEVLLAKARLDQAIVNLNRTIIKAPIGGIIAKRQVELGQRVQAGTPLLSIVPTQNIYVNANFKEVKLGKVKVGQDVIVHADIYGDDVTYHGKVEGFSGGTGAAFSLIPAQNATGNWIKVVQRVPVRIKLLPEELKAHPLKVGLSMDVEINTFNQK